MLIKWGHLSIKQGIHAVADPRGGAPGACPPWTKIFLISCSFLENLANLYAPAPLLEGWHPLLWGVLDLPLTCQSNRNACQLNRNTCQSNGNTCQPNSNTCQSNRNTCQSNRNTCQSKRTHVNQTGTHVNQTGTHVNQTGNTC